MTAPGGSRAAVPAEERSETVRSAFLRGANTYGDLGSSLYAALLRAGADEPDLVTLACNAQAGSQPAFHLLAVVHFLLLRDPDDPLARYFATLTDDPASPDAAFPEFVRYSGSIAIGFSTFSPRGLFRRPMSSAAASCCR